MTCTPNTPEENAAQMRRAAGKQPDPFRTRDGFHFGKLPDTQKTIPYHARTIR